MGAVSGPVRSVEEDDEIQTAVIESFGDVGSVTDVEGKADFRILLMKGRRGFEDALARRAADGDGAADILVCRGDFLFRFFEEGNDFFSSFSQEYPIGRKGDASFAPNQQLFSQFRFQFHQLFRKRRLGNVQGFGGASDILFPGRSQKVA